MGFAKSAGNYGGAMLPARKAVEEGFDQLIWTDAKEHKYVEEMGAANAMFVLDGKLITPSTRDTILDGVTRDTVLTLAREWEFMPVEEKSAAYRLPRLLKALKTGKLTGRFPAPEQLLLLPM